jgi:tetratricopeptide (TPR) repeat protein
MALKPIVKSSNDDGLSLRSPEVWVAGVSLIIRLWFLGNLAASPFFEPNPGGNDRALYHGLAQQVANGHFFPEGVFEYMPFYPWLLGLLYTVTGPVLGLNLVGWLGALLDSATTFLIVRIALRLGAPKGAAVLMGVIYSLYPIAIVYSAMTMANSTNAFLFTAFGFCVLEMEKMERRDRRPYYFALGLLAGLTALSFAGMLLIGAIYSLYLLGTRCLSSSKTEESLRSRILIPVLFLVGALIPILPVTIHNWRAEHRLVLITAHGGFNFYMGNHEDATGYPVQIGNFRRDAGSLLADARAEAEENAGRKLLASEFSSYWSNKAWRFIREHPVQELRLLVSKIFRFWNHDEYDDMRLLPMFKLTGVAFTSPLWPSFGWIGVVGLLGLFFARGARLLKVISLLGILGVILFFITARYRLTFVPVLAILGALGIGEIYVRRRDWKIWVFAAALVCFVWMPLSKTDFRALDHYNAASYMMARKMPKEALVQTSAGIALEPKNADLHLVQGNALFLLNRTVEAAQSYQETIRLKPSHASAHFNLGQTWMMLNRPEDAAKEAELALKYDPRHSGAKKLLQEIQSAPKR